MMQTPSALEKARLLLGVATRRPGEAVDRMRALVESRADRFWPRSGRPPASDLSGALTRLEAALERPLVTHLAEEPLRALEAELATAGAALAGPFTTEHSADLSLGRACYALCRALRPEVALETGVAYGVTSAFVLAAMARNGRGALHSVDLPPLARGADAHVGALVPASLRSRWTLHRGASRRVLPALLGRLGPITLFVHDSLHTYLNVRDELRLVGPRLARPAAVVIDDADMNGAPDEWAERNACASAWIAEERKRRTFAVALAR
jgi:cephalosporin hydroxylase